MSNNCIALQMVRGGGGGHHGKINENVLECGTWNFRLEFLRKYKLKNANKIILF